MGATATGANDYMRAGAAVPSWVPEYAKYRFAALMQQIPAVAAAIKVEDMKVWSAWMSEAAPDGLPAVASALSQFQQAMILQARALHL
jgi:hypothetical protein